MKASDPIPFFSWLGEMRHNGFLEFIVEKLQWIYTPTIS